MAKKKNNLMKNPMFNSLLNNLHSAKSAPPATSTPVLGFTKMQIMRMAVKNPRLVWYDAVENKFYDQGDANSLGKHYWYSLNAFNYKKDKPMEHLEYYIPISNAKMKETEQILAKEAENTQK